MIETQGEKILHFAEGEERHEHGEKVAGNGNASTDRMLQACKDHEQPGHKAQNDYWLAMEIWARRKPVGNYCDVGEERDENPLRRA